MAVNDHLILSIDDSKAVHAFIEMSCKNSKYKVIHAMSGSEGIEVLKTNPEQPIIILLDWEMPEKNGPDVYKDIRAFGYQGHIVMVTTKNQPSEIMQMLDAGASDYIMKPFTPEILLEKIEMVLGRL